jgi:hypothetical protein
MYCKICHSWKKSETTAQIFISRKQGFLAIKNEWAETPEGNSGIETESGGNLQVLLFPFRPSLLFKKRFPLFMDDSDKLLSFALNVRVYGLKFDANVSHSYLVDDVFSGTSAPIGEFHIDIRKCSLVQLRPMIQYDKSGHMDKRSMMFQEALFLMQRMPNYFERPKVQWNKYIFGFLSKVTDELTLINPEDEAKPIAELIGATDYFSVDLAIVPLTQLPLNNKFGV